jgi:hypothetical protein
MATPLEQVPRPSTPAFAAAIGVCCHRHSSRTQKLVGQVALDEDGRVRAGQEQRALCRRGLAARRRDLVVALGAGGHATAATAAAAAAATTARIW